MAPTEKRRSWLRTALVVLAVLVGILVVGGIILLGWLQGTYPLPPPSPTP